MSCKDCRNYEPRPKHKMEIELLADGSKRLGHYSVELMDLKVQEQPGTYTFDLPERMEEIARDAVNLQLKVHIFP